MSLLGKVLSCLSIVGLLVATTIGMGPTGAEASAALPLVREAQTIAKKFSMPVGVVDGVYGAQTGRGLCAFRSISGLPVNRATVDTATITKLRSYNARYTGLTRIPAPALSGRTTYLVANKTCQTMVYVRSGYYQVVMPISTGMSGHDTPSGYYSLGGTQRGWHCSTLYPESCSTQTTGRFVGISRYGNMYNQRQIRGAVYLHGSTSVPTYPASHGCVRVTVAYSDWMYDNVAASTLLRITGAY